MEIPQPVDQITAANPAKIHQVNHDASWDVAREKDTEHHEVGFRQPGFHFYRSLPSLVLLGGAVVQTFDLRDLDFGVLKDTHVGKDKNENGAEHRDVRKDESVGDKAHEEENRGEGERKQPHQAGCSGHAPVAGVGPVPHRLGDRKVAIDRQCCKAQQGRRAAEEVYRLREPGHADGQALCLAIVRVDGQRFHQSADDQVSDREIGHQQCEWTSQVLIGIDQHRQDDHQVSWHRDDEKKNGQYQGGYGHFRWSPDPDAMTCPKSHDDRDPGKNNVVI